MGEQCHSYWLKHQSFCIRNCDFKDDDDCPYWKDEADAENKYYNIDINKEHEVNKMAEWKDIKGGAILINDDKMVGFVCNVPLKARQFDKPEMIDIDADARRMPQNRQAVYLSGGRDPVDVEQARRAVEQACKVIVNNEERIIANNLLAFLAKIKEYEIRGKIELVIRIEGYNPPEVKRD